MTIGRPAYTNIEIDLYHKDLTINLSNDFLIKLFGFNTKTFYFRKGRS